MYDINKSYHNEKLGGLNTIWCHWRPLHTHCFVASRITSQNRWWRLQKFNKQYSRTSLICWCRNHSNVSSAPPLMSVQFSICYSFMTHTLTSHTHGIYIVICVLLQNGSVCGFYTHYHSLARRHIDWCFTATHTCGSPFTSTLHYYTHTWTEMLELMK